ncbi:hypothetical protein NMG60_11001002 [Bertholletia excelsa]
MILSSFNTCVKRVVRLSGCFQRQMNNHISALRKSFSGSCIFKQNNGCHSLMVKNRVNSKTWKISVDFSLVCQNVSVKVFVPRPKRVAKIKCNVEPTGLDLGSLVCSSTSRRVHSIDTESSDCKENSSFILPHGKKVYTDYSIIGIQGDGRCLFRSVVHGACLRSGKPAPEERLQRELADELRAMVADEFVKRREETEWFIEGNFETYVANMRKPHIWGGEPELLMASHVLQMPITVYMRRQDCDGLITIAEYGQEYGKEDPIRLLYHGYGHYDTLQIPGKKGAKSKRWKMYILDKEDE